jgi:hypothetical protein
MIAALVEQPSARLLKHIIRCYLRLADNPRAREALRPTLPDRLRDGTFAHVLKAPYHPSRSSSSLCGHLMCMGEFLCALSDSVIHYPPRSILYAHDLFLQDDHTTKRWLTQLLQHLNYV